MIDTHSIIIVNENNCTQPLHLSHDTFKHFRMVESFSVTDSNIEQLSSIDLRPFTMLQYLNLSSNDIFELWPYSFGWATHLETLDLSHNQIATMSFLAFAREESPSSAPVDSSEEQNDSPYILMPTTYRPFVEQFSPIRFLFLDHNKLTSLDDQRFEVLPRLEVITLNNNLLKSIDPEWLFHTNERLQVLHVSHNYLQRMSDIGTLRAMDDVDLSDNPLVSTKALSIDAGIINVSNINAVSCRIGWRTRQFDGSWNNISSVHMDRSDSHSRSQQTMRLMYLNLAHNLIESVTNFTDLPRLINLDLSHNLLQTIQADDFLGLPNLKDLCLDSNQLHQIDVTALHAMTDIRTLHLAQNRLVSFQLPSHMHNLIELDVFGNNLTTIDLNLRRKASELQRIYAGNNNWDCTTLTAAILVLGMDHIDVLSSKNQHPVYRDEYNASVKGIGCHGITRPTAVEDYLPTPGVASHFKEKFEILIDEKMHEFETRILDVIANITNQNMVSMNAKMVDLLAKFNTTDNVL